MSFEEVLQKPLFTKIAENVVAVQETILQDKFHMP